MARVPAALVRNWQLKLSALGLSVFLWALVQTEPLSQETFAAVPVVVQVADTAWTTAGAPTPEVVELRLGGPAREIIRLARDGTRVRVPVTSVGSADTVITLQRDWVELGQGAGVTVESISPATLRVTFERAVTATVSVSLRIQGSLPSELALSSPLEMNPATVVVRGPESRLSGLDSIPVAALDLSRVRESDIFTLPVDTSGLAGASVVPPDVMVGVRVEPRIERDVSGIVVRTDLRGAGWTVAVEPASIRLRLSGARTLVTALDPSLLRVSVPSEALAGMVPGEERRLRVEVGGVPELVTATPETEVVTVRRVDDPSDGGQEPS